MDKGEKCWRCFLSGDNEGFEELVLMYRKGLTVYINSIVRNADTAEELMEDTFAKLFVKRPAFRGKSSFKTWLYAIGRRMALDFLRRDPAARETSAELCGELSSGDDPEQNLIRQEEKIMLHRAMQALNADYRQILYLIFFEDFTNTEAAVIMKKSDKQIRDLLYHAKKALRTELERSGSGHEGI